MTHIHRVSRISVGIAAVAALLLVLAAPASAQKPTKDRQLYSMEYDMINPCNGELMHMTDRWQVRVSFQENQDGCAAVKIHVNDMGSKGVTESGVSYQFPYAASVRQSFSCDGCTIEETHVMTYKLVGQGAAPNFTMKMSYRLIYNFCTDELTIIRMSQSATCDGEPL